MSMGFYACFDDLLCVHVLRFYCSACFCSWSADPMKPGIGRHHQVVRMISWSPCHHQKQLGTVLHAVLTFMCFSGVCEHMWRWHREQATSFSQHNRDEERGTHFRLRLIHCCCHWAAMHAMADWTALAQERAKAALVGFSAYFFPVWKPS